jgi:hypothetical protein
MQTQVSIAMQDIPSERVFEFQAGHWVIGYFYAGSVRQAPVEHSREWSASPFSTSTSSPWTTATR